MAGWMMPLQGPIIVFFIFSTNINTQRGQRNVVKQPTVLELSNFQASIRHIQIYILKKEIESWQIYGRFWIWIILNPSFYASKSWEGHVQWNLMTPVTKSRKEAWQAQAWSGPSSSMPAKTSSPPCPPWSLWWVTSLHPSPVTNPPKKEIQPSSF